jgi:glycolate oxidase FAD binding subunit
MQRPDNAEELAETLRSLAEEHRSIRLGGNFSKDRGGGAAAEGAVVSTAAMKRLLSYDPRDLTISVEAGMPFTELERTLADHGQILPLDPPWRSASTVGGVVAAGLSGPRRRQYGTARDMIIGMTFATLEGKLVKSGGMVVKNVAGLDMAKLMIGSFGTLAAIAVVNFKVFPAPPGSRTFVREFPTIDAAFAERDRILRSVMQPTAIDIVNWPAGIRMLVRATGNAAVLDRWTRDSSGAEIHEASSESQLWNAVHEFTPRFLAEHPHGAVVPIHTTLSAMPAAAARLDLPFIARAGSGVIYAHYSENAPQPNFGGGFEMMVRVRQMFDPERLLNRGRLYDRI